jgi:hypothetical protein
LEGYVEDGESEDYLLRIDEDEDVAIPTLTEWGIIIFMTVIMGIGVMMIMRKRRMV